MARLDADGLETLIQMLPLAALADSSAWRRFLGLAAAAASLLEAPEACAELLGRLACTAALLAEPRAARTAVRLATAGAWQAEAPRLAPVLAPLLRSGFLRKGASTRGDLLVGAPIGNGGRGRGNARGSWRNGRNDDEFMLLWWFPHVFVIFRGPAGWPSRPPSGREGV